MWFVGGTICGRLEIRLTVFQFEIGVFFWGFLDLVDACGFVCCGMQSVEN